MSGPTHGDGVANALDFMMNLAPPAEAQPATPAPRQAAAEPAAAAEPPVAPEPPRPAPASPATPPRPRRRPPEPAEAPAPAKETEAVAPRKRGRPKKDPASLKKPVPVGLDRDLAELMRFAVPALGGLTHSQLMFDAARAYGRVAASLPDAPAAVTFHDDYYDEVVTEAARRIQVNGYMTELGRARFDADADAALLTRSDFACRTLRAYLTVDKVFLPADLMHMLVPPHLGDVVERLKARLDSGLPGITMASIEAPNRQRPWAKVDLPTDSVFSELRDLAAEAMEGGMPGCMSATEAILTVLL